MDPWGLGYKIVNWKLGLFKLSELLDSPTTERVIDELLLVHPPSRARTIDVPADAIPPFSEEERIAAAKVLKREGPLDPTVSRLRYCWSLPFSALPRWYKCITRV